jgi:hypothetical protein
MGLGSGIRKKPIPDPGVKKAPDPGSATLAVLVSILMILLLFFLELLFRHIRARACEPEAD